MTEVLGEAVLDLTADLGQQRRALAESEMMTRRSLDAQGREIDKFNMRVIGAGESMRRMYLNPLEMAFGQLAIAAKILDERFEKLDGSVQVLNQTLIETANSADRMVGGLLTAMSEIRSASDSARDAIVINAEMEIRAINAVRDAYLEEAAAARLAAGESGAATRAAVGVVGPGGSVIRPALMPAPEHMGGGGGIWGSRGIWSPGSINNPVVVAIEAGQYAGLGARAAALGFSSTPTPNSPGGAGSADMAALLSLMRGMAPQYRPQIPQTNMVVWEPSAGGIQGPVRMLPPGGGGGGPPPFMYGKDPLAIEMAKVAGLLGAAAGSGRTVYQMPSSFRPGFLTGAAGTGGEQTVRLDAAQFAGFIAAGAAGGNAPPPFNPTQLVGLLPSGGGPSGPPSGGGGGFWGSLFGSFGGGGLGHTLLMGNRPRLPFLGALPLAGFGSLGSFAGLGLEHVLMTGLGLAGSAATAVGGAGLLGLGSLGSLAVGGGSNAAVMSSTISDTRTLSQAQQQLTTAQQSLVQSQSAYNKALAKFGPNATQTVAAQSQLQTSIQNVTSAQQNLNNSITSLGGMTAGVKAELQLAKQTTALNTFWDKQTSLARVAAVHILEQVVSLGHDYVPRIAQAAQQNLTIINQDIKPLFTWLEGPQGIGIFNNLENNFKRNLPTAIDAFTQGMQVLLRVTSIASNYTGGLIHWLDTLFGRLNSMSNIQYTNFIERLISDFHVWDNFVKALFHDLVLLFSNDSATGRSIVVNLTHMLDKLGQWERSVQGRSGLMTIFAVHKQEVLTLLQIIPDFVKAIGPIYMTIAPAMTTAFTAVAGAILDVVKALEQLPGGAWLVGIAVLMAKLKLLMPVLRGVGGALGVITAEETAGAGAAAVDAAAQGGLATAMTTGAGARFAAGSSSTAALATGAETAAGGGLLARFGLGAMGKSLATRIMGTGVGARAVGALGIDAAALPGLLSGGLAVGGGVLGGGFLQQLTGLRKGSLATLGGGVAGGLGGAGLAALVGAPFGPPGMLITSLLGATLGPTITHAIGTLLGSGSHTGLNAQQTTQLLQRSDLFSKAPLPGQALQGATGQTVSGFTPQDIASTKSAKQALDQWVLTATNSAAVGKMNTEQLKAMINEGGNLAKVFPQYANVIDRYTGRMKDVLKPLEGIFGTMTRRWDATARADLPLLVGTFDTNLRLIANKLSLTSADGKRAVAGQVHDMISQTELAMKDGRVKVGAGLAAINHAIHQGVKDGAITWQTGNQEMVDALQSAYHTGLLSSQAYYADLHKITGTGLSNLASQENTSLSARIARVKALFQQGNDGMVVTQRQLNQQIHGLRQQANQQEQSDLSNYVNNIFMSMNKSGTLTGGAMQIIIKELNKALTELGGSKLAVPTIEVLNQAPGGNLAVTPTGVAQPGGNRLAGATGMRVVAPMYMVGEEAPNHPEYVLATNPAYRNRNVGLWAQAGHDLEIPGFARGGATSRMSEMIAEANLINSKHYPYVWGGGHNSSFSGPYDCSGAVSAVLHSAGLLRAPEVSGQFMSYGLPGPGPATLYANPTHVFMSLDGHFFGTHGASGAGWYPGSPQPGFVERHPPIAGGPGGIGINIPKVGGTGALADVTRRAVNKAGDAATRKLMRIFNQMTAGGQFGGGNWGTFTGALTGPVEHEVFQFFSAHGFDKIAIAGMLGNAMQESTMNPNASGGGLWQQISNFGSGTGGSLLNQMQIMLPQIMGFRGALNAASNPGMAAALFMNDFEKPLQSAANLPNREAAARAAFAAGYQQGGVVDFAGAFPDGGMVTASSPTMALFGDNGMETALFIPHGKIGAVRHAQTGQRIAGRTVTGHTKSGTPYSGNGSSRMYFYPGSGWISGAQLDKRFQRQHPTTGGAAVAPTTAKTIADLLLLDHLHFGSLHETARAFRSMDLPAGHPFDLLSPALGDVSKTGMAAILAAISTRLSHMPPDQQINIATKGAQALKTADNKLREAMQDLRQDARKHHANASKDRKELKADTHLLAVRSAIQQKLLSTAVTALSNQWQTMSQNQTNLTDLFTSLANLSLGTNLRKLGVTPAILKRLGLNPSQVAGAIGGGPNVYQQEQQAQGGVLTPAQLNAAQDYYKSLNSILAGQQQADRSELKKLMRDMPKEGTRAYTTWKTTVESLIAAISGLGGQISSNTTALNQLTSATNTNTSATGAMTGSVGYAYQGQNYLASVTGMTTGLGV